MVMTSAARATIAQALSAALVAASPTIEIQPDGNDGFTPPNNATWARLTFLDGAKTIAAYGGTGNLWRGPLLAYVDIFTPLGIGDAEAVDLCEAVRAAARAITSPGLTLRSFQTGPEGISEGWFRKQQIVVFDHSERG